MRVSLRSHRQLAVLGFVGMLGIGGAAFAASNTVPTSNAGSGTSVVSGYVVSDVAYAPDVDMTEVGTITFAIVRTSSGIAVADLNAEVNVSVDGGTTWKTCTVVAGAATCDFTGDGVTFDSVDTLDVVAYDI